MYSRTASRIKCLSLVVLAGAVRVRLAGAVRVRLAGAVRVRLAGAVRVRQGSPRALMEAVR